MRAIVLACVLSVCVSCSLFEPQYVPLSQQNVAALETSLGALDTANAELVRAEASRILGVPVEDVAKLKTASGEVWIAKLSPPAEDIAAESVTTFWDRIIADPTATGAGAALMAAAAAGLAAWRRRKAVTGTVTGVVTIPVPGTVPEPVDEAKP